MTLDEAIEHANQVAGETCGECSAEHRQLAEWLETLRDFEDENAHLSAENYELLDRLKELEDENAHLKAGNYELRMYYDEIRRQRTKTCHMTYDFSGTQRICSECGHPVGLWVWWLYCPECGGRFVPKEEDR